MELITSRQSHNRVLLIHGHQHPFDNPCQNPLFSFQQTSNLHEALVYMQNQSFGAVLVSLPQSDHSPEDLLTELMQANSQVPVVFHHPEGHSDELIRLVKLGAFDAMAGAWEADRVGRVIERAVEYRRSLDLDALERGVGQEPWRRLLVGTSPAMQRVCDLIQLVGSRRSTVLITGETGTGKEMVARAIHLASDRSRLPLVGVNCAALPTSLVEAELFGHTKGAFTGAVTARPGRFEQANRSTIFLDEIGDLPLEIQSKLLRVLQEREIQRLGSSETQQVDVRVIAATNVNLEDAVKDGRFREDLFYRMNVVPIRLPALRERRSDIPQLVHHFVEKICCAEGIDRKIVPLDTLEWLSGHDWPGNVRQLEHAVEMAVVLSGSRQTLLPSDFPPVRRAKQVDMRPASPWVAVPNEGLKFDEVVGCLERTLLEQALTISSGNKALAAHLLGLKRTTLVAKIKTLALAC